MTERERLHNIYSTSTASEENAEGSLYLYNCSDYIAGSRLNRTSTTSSPALPSPPPPIVVVIPSRGSCNDNSQRIRGFISQWLLQHGKLNGYKR